MNAQSSPLRVRVSCLLLLAAVAACRSEPSATTSPAASAAPSSAPAPRAASTALVPGVVDAAASPDGDMKALVAAWSRALDSHDVDALASLYAPRVRFYGTKEISRAAVLDAKRRALGPKSTFHQQITSDVTVLTNDAGIVTATFTKRSGTKKLTDVQARLGAVRGDGGALLITEETDVPSLTHDEQKRREACYEAASSVVQELPRVKKLMADVKTELAKYPDRMLGGIGPLEEDDGFTAGLGVHQPTRYESMVWYSVNRAGELTVTAMADDVPVPAEAKAKVAAACKQP